MLIMLLIRYIRPARFLKLRQQLRHHRLVTSLRFLTQPGHMTARTAVSKASDVREDKIADIKARMAAGTYNISSEAVADKILNNISTLTF